jgi:hypothetical protein
MDQLQQRVQVGPAALQVYKETVVEVRALLIPVAVTAALLQREVEQ